MFSTTFLYMILLLKMLYIEMSLVMLSLVEPGKFFILLSSLCCVQHFDTYTRTFNVVMPAGLHLIMVHKHVTRIDIQHIVNLISSLESMGEHFCIPEAPFIALSFIFQFIRMLYGLFQHPSQFFKRLHRQSESQLLVLSSHFGKLNASFMTFLFIS